MYDPVAVRVPQGVGEALEDVQALAERLTLADPVLETASRKVGHGQIMDVSRDTNVVDGHDVGVGELRDEASLVQETPAEVLIDDEELVHDLQGHVPGQRLLNGQIDRRHPPLAQYRFRPVPRYLRHPRLVSFHSPIVSYARPPSGAGVRHQAASHNQTRSRSRVRAKVRRSAAALPTPQECRSGSPPAPAARRGPSPATAFRTAAGTPLGSRSGRGRCQPPNRHVHKTRNSRAAAVRGAVSAVARPSVGPRRQPRQDPAI